jgi:hypothetical protein
MALLAAPRTKDDGAPTGPPTDRLESPRWTTMRPYRPMRRWPAWLDGAPLPVASGRVRSEAAQSERGRAHAASTSWSGATL